MPDLNCMMASMSVSPRTVRVDEADSERRHSLVRLEVLDEGRVGEAAAQRHRKAGGGSACESLFAAAKQAKPYSDSKMHNLYKCNRRLRHAMEGRGVGGKGSAVTVAEG